MSKSRFETDTSESRAECPLIFTDDNERPVGDIKCVFGIRTVDSTRHPYCPLETVSENKEFTIGVIGRMGSEYRAYNVRAQNKKRAKEKALELFRDECGENFENVSVSSAWEHKEAKDE